MSVIDVLEKIGNGTYVKITWTDSSGHRFVLNGECSTLKCNVKDSLLQSNVSFISVEGGLIVLNI